MAAREVEHLFAEAQSLERDLRTACTGRAGAGDPAASALRSKLCSAYEVVLFSDYSFAQVL